jgi:hypothetical protein
VMDALKGPHMSGVTRLLHQACAVPISLTSDVIYQI